MRVAVFSTKPHDERFLIAANQDGRHELLFLDARLSPPMVAAAAGADVVCAFVNDDLGAEVLTELAALGIRLVALRSAGFNHVDLLAAKERGIAVARVPEYSPHAIAEHTAALILSLNRKIHRAYARVREGNFSLEGLMGFDLHGCTVGAIGTGKIGRAFLGIMRGFGCDLVAYDLFPNAEVEAMGARYVDLQSLLAQSDIISLHCPLTPETFHLINTDAIAAMRKGAMLVNTSRGAVIDTSAAIGGLKSGQLGSLALDVYEEEGDLFFENLSDQVIQDDVFARLLTFPNVLITGHQAFFTEDALRAIAEMTIANISAFERDGAPLHAVSSEQFA
ncbi:2-hydroxyacid dehydrogenase [Bauldia sp.]|uniref:2-hydroxyacid dehydrogenase n=1 Tax=Bauldia sp. TaxID=2575872 RepID=UPI003BA91EA9